jgi:hypothetical protein
MQGDGRNDKGEVGEQHPYDDERVSATCRSGAQDRFQEIGANAPHADRKEREESEHLQERLKGKEEENIGF